jgi:nitroreductase
MSSTSRPARGESVPQPRQSAVTDQGGLLVGTIIRQAAQSSKGEKAGARRAGSAASPSESDRPGSALSPADLAKVIAISARAPSVHNTQPWKFRVVDDAVELHADPDRILAHIDPVGRDLIISCGAALFGLRLGFRHLGCLPAVQLWPDPAQPWLIARSRPDAYVAVNSAEAELLAAVPHRHTHRGPFTPGEVPQRLLAVLAADAAAEGSELRFVEQPDLVSELVAVVYLAATEQEASAEIRAETRDWARPSGSQARDGVPAHAARGADELASQPGQRFRVRNFGESSVDSADAGGGGPKKPPLHGAAGAQADAGNQAAEPPVVTAVLATPGDTRDDWLCAGQALNRLLLRAATRWVFASLQSQPMESPRYRDQVRDLLMLPGHPQMLLQFGRANTAPATPRRPQAEYRTNEKRG